MLVAFLSDALASNGNIKISRWYEQLCHPAAAVEVILWHPLWFLPDPPQGDSSPLIWPDPGLNCGVPQLASPGIFLPLITAPLLWLSALISSPPAEPLCQVCASSLREVITPPRSQAQIKWELRPHLMVSFRTTLRSEIGWRLPSSFLLLVFSCLQPDADELGQTGTRALTQAPRGQRCRHLGLFQRNLLISVSGL